MIEYNTAMEKEIYLPEKIKNLISGKDYIANEVGMSEAKVMVFDDCVLKISPFQKQNEETVEVMRWLDGKLPVPKVLCYESNSEYQAQHGENQILHLAG